MERYTSATYGDAFADVYDEWYAGVSDVATTVDLLAELAARSTGGATPGRALELGVGTGRLALPLAARGLEVTGVDASAAMIERLHGRDVDGRVRTIVGDMVTDLPPGPFDVLYVAYNTFFNLPSPEAQRACFAAVAARLARRGAFLVEAFVPERDPPRAGTHVGVRSMTATDVVLEVTHHDPHRQQAEGQFIHLADGQPVRLRPWAIRYCPPDELDAMAAAAGLVVADRWEDVTGRPFQPDSPRHVSIYTLTASAPAPR